MPRHFRSQFSHTFHYVCSSAAARLQQRGLRGSYPHSAHSNSFLLLRAGPLPHTNRQALHGWGCTNKTPKHCPLQHCTSFCSALSSRSIGHNVAYYEQTIYLRRSLTLLLLTLNFVLLLLWDQILKSSH